MSKFPTPNDNLIQRAARAHRIFVSKNGGVADIPSNSASGVFGRTVAPRR